MQILENDSAMISFPASNTEDAPHGNPETVRLNTMVDPPIYF